MRILVADDHDIIRRGVRSLLEDQPDFSICGEAVNGREAIEQALQLKPDAIIMDLSMPQVNGFEATREICRLLPEVQVIILSQHDSTQVLREALNSGARGYVTKSSMDGGLIAALQKLRKQEGFVDPAIGQDGSNAPSIKEILRRSAACEEALVESEEQFRSTFELAPVGIAHIAPDGHWLRLNRKACEILGYPQEELLKLTFRDVTHPADLPADLALREQLVAGLLPQYSLEKRYVQKNGSIVWVNLTVSSVRDTEDKVKYLIAVAEDISKRREWQDALKRSEAKLQLLAGSLERRVAERTRELAAKNTEMERQTEIVQQLSSRLLQAGDEERRRIARDLHDSAGQTLTAVGLNLAAIEREANEVAPEVASTAAEGRALVKQLIEEIRTLSYLLHPPLLEESGLIGAISWLADGITKRSQIDVKLELAEEIGRLPQDLELAVFRIVQECLANVYRHSGSKSATIRLDRDSQELLLQVVDEGRGISPHLLNTIQTSGAGVGLRGIQERIRPFSGSFDIQSNRNGTKIEVKFPLQKAAAHAN
jgi:two-component system, NarL family, sensor histidine kinase UhpB